jgi:NodT family efflux transporter outer membrane factor (OMF) lipoprotein
MMTKQMRWPLKNGDVTQMKPFCSIIAAVLISAGLWACAPFAPAPRAPGKEMVPSAYSDTAPETENVQRWWETFNDDQLNALVEEALANNYSLQQSWARLKQARVLAVISGAQRYPALNLGSDASVTRRRVSDGQSASTDTVEVYSVGLSSSYEVDLWGRIRSEKEAATLSAEASREDLNAAAVTLTANVASRWIGVLSQRMQKQLLERQLEANITLEELVELRFRKSLASALDVFQQRQLVAQSRSQIPLVERSERQLLNELALLLGRTPFRIPQITSQAFEIPAQVPATGLPVQLLTARPDIQGAMRRLEAADWNVASAKADRLPRLDLSAGATYQAQELNLLWDNWLLNLVGTITAPLLDGGRRKAEVQRLEAVVEENLAAYRQTILAAVQEVEDALVGEEKLQAHLEALQTQLDAAKNALNEARSRYRSGLSDYLPVLTQLVTVQNLERTTIQRKADLLVARVNLHRALGGTWVQQPRVSGTGVAKAPQ